jgi:hypothetical protein
LTSARAAAPPQPLRLDSSRAVTAFFSKELRDGRWVVPDRLLVTAIGGHVVLDLREALLQGRHTIVQATVVGGQLNLLIPDGVAVIITGTRGAERGRAVDQRSGPVGPAGVAEQPLIEVRALTMLGQVRVHRPRPHGGRWRGVFPRRDRRLP